MPFHVTVTNRLLGSLITLAIGGTAAHFIARVNALASLGLGLVLAALIFVALTLAARTDGIGGLTGHRLIAFVLVLATVILALGITFWMQPGMPCARALSAMMFACAAVYVVAALHALARMRKDRAGP